MTDFMKVRVFVRPTTRKQREAVFNKFQQDFPSLVTPTKRLRHPERWARDGFPYTFKELDAFAERHPGAIVKVPSIQYRRFRKQFINYGDYIGGQWKGMFLGIEKDGYAHT